MNDLELYIYQALADILKVEEFENIIYQEYYVNQIDSNQFINDTVTINYRSPDWKEKLELLIKQKGDVKKFLSYQIRKYCLGIVEYQDLKNICNAIYSLSSLNSKYGYNYETLLQFYYFDNDLSSSLTNSNTLFKGEMMQRIKSYAQLHVDTYDAIISDHKGDYDILLNLKEKLDCKNNRTESGEVPNYNIKVRKNKKWFQLWK